jgi:flagellar basal body-associated protein FliL
MLSKALLLALGTACSFSCAGTPKYLVEDCPLYTELEEIKVNPAGALDRHLRARAVFKVCPPDEGLTEIRRKRIELKHELISLLSSMTREELEHPRRIENLREKILFQVNEKLMKKGRVIDVSITEFELL